MFTDPGWNDYVYWQGQDKKIVTRIHALIESAKRTPPESIGKPEPLLHDLAGLWSRRINQEHRLVYQADDETLTVIACRYHY
jgi:toxin YoeB